jgi:ABC-type sugar transport system ATPase subunit
MEVALEGVRLERGGRPVLAVDALTIESGRAVAVLGPNGSGKTTLLRAIAGLDRPVAGAILVGGIPAHERQRTAERVAFAFQDLVFLHRSVRANLDLALDLRGVPGSERERRIAAVAGTCGVDHLLDRRAPHLSGGEARRVNLARALAQRAGVTLLDEPLAGVDRQMRETLLRDLPAMLDAFATTTVVVTHDRDEAFRMADAVVIVADGRVRAAGPKRNIFEHPPDAASALVLGYAVFEDDGQVVAIAPESLRPGQGQRTFAARVRGVVDLGTHTEALCEIGGETIPVRIAPGCPLPAPGEVMTVSSDRVIIFPA